MSLNTLWMLVNTMCMLLYVVSEWCSYTQIQQDHYKPYLVHNITKYATTYKFLSSKSLLWLRSCKVQEFMMKSSNGNIFRVTGHLCGEFTGSGEFPTQRPVTRSFDISLIYVWINDWVNNREAGDLRRHLTPYDVIIMCQREIVWLTKYIDTLLNPKATHASSCLWLLHRQLEWVNVKRRYLSSKFMSYLHKTLDLQMCAKSDINLLICAKSYWFVDVRKYLLIYWYMQKYWFTAICKELSNYWYVWKLFIYCYAQKATNRLIS